MVAKEGGVQTIVINMQFFDSMNVAELGCMILANLVVDSEERANIVLEAGGLAAVVNSLKQYSKNAQISTEACWAIGNLATGSEIIREEIVKLGGVEAIVECMNQSYKKSPQLAEHSCLALGNLALSSGTTSESRCQIIGKSKGIEAIIGCLNHYIETNSVVVEAACCSLINISGGSKAHCDVIVDVNGIESVIQCINLYRESNTQIIRQSCWILANICAGTERRNGRRCNSVAEKGGADIVKSCLVQFGRNNEGIVEPACGTIANLVFNSTERIAKIVGPDMVSAIVSSLKFVSIRHAQAAKAACRALQNITCWSNATSEEFSDIIVQEGAVTSILDCLNHFGMKDLEIAECTCALLANLSCGATCEERCAEIARQNGIAMVVGCIRVVGLTNLKVFDQAWKVMSNLTKNAESRREAVFQAAGVELLRSSLNAYKVLGGVALEHLCRTIKQMTSGESQDVGARCKAIVQSDISLVLVQVLNHCSTKNSIRIIEQLCFCLSNLSSGVEGYNEEFRNCISNVAMPTIFSILHTYRVKSSAIAENTCNIIANLCEGCEANPSHRCISIFRCNGISVLVETLLQLGFSNPRVVEKICRALAGLSFGSGETKESITNAIVAEGGLSATIDIIKHYTEVNENVTEQACCALGNMAFGNSEHAKVRCGIIVACKGLEVVIIALKKFGLTNLSIATRVCSVLVNLVEAHQEQGSDVCNKIASLGGFTTIVSILEKFDPEKNPIAQYFCNGLLKYISLSEYTTMQLINVGGAPILMDCLARLGFANECIAANIVQCLTKICKLDDIKTIIAKDIGINTLVDFAVKFKNSKHNIVEGLAFILAELCVGVRNQDVENRCRLVANAGGFGVAAALLVHERSYQFSVHLLTILTNLGVIKDFIYTEIIEKNVSRQLESPESMNIHINGDAGTASTLSSYMLDGKVYNQTKLHMYPLLTIIHYLHSLKLCDSMLIAHTCHCLAIFLQRSTTAYHWRKVFAEGNGMREILLVLRKYGNKDLNITVNGCKCLVNLLDVQDPAFGLYSKSFINADGVELLLKILYQNGKQDESIPTFVCGCLRNLAKWIDQTDRKLEIMHVHSLTRMMQILRAFKTNPSVVEQVCWLLCNLLETEKSTSGEYYQSIILLDAPLLAVECLRSTISLINPVSGVIALMIKLCAHNVGRNLIIEKNGISLLLQVLRVSTNDNSIQLVCDLLRLLSLQQPEHLTIVDNHCVKLLFNTLSITANQPVVVSAISLLTSLVLREQAKEMWNLVAESGGISTLVAILYRFGQLNSTISESTCNLIVQLVEEEKEIASVICSAIIDSGGIVALVNMMRKFGDCPRLVDYVCKLLLHIAGISEDRKNAIVNAGSVDAIKNCLQSCIEDQQVVTSASLVLRRLSSGKGVDREVRCGAIDKAGCIPALLMSLNHYGKRDPHISATICGTLCNIICKTDERIEIILSVNGVAFIVSTLQQFKKTDSQVVENACALLLNLSCGSATTVGLFFDLLIENNGVAAMVECLRCFGHVNPIVARAVCRTLKNMLSGSEVQCKRYLHTILLADGLSALVYTVRVLGQRDERISNQVFWILLKALEDQESKEACCTAIEHEGGIPTFVSLLQHFSRDSQILNSICLLFYFFAGSTQVRANSVKDATHEGKLLHAALQIVSNQSDERFAELMSIIQSI